MTPRLAAQDLVVCLGGTGLLGAEIAASFVTSGVPTRIVARRPPDWLHADRVQGAELVLGDIEDSDCLETALSDASHVVYSVGSSYPASSNSDPIGDVRGTLPGLLGVLEFMRSRPGRRFTLLSSGGAVYGNPVSIPVVEEAPCEPLSSYGVLKLASEKYVSLYSKLYGLDGHVLRISNAYGPLQMSTRGQGVIASFLSAARRADPVRMFGDGSIVRDYVHVSDVAKAIVDLSQIDEIPSVCNVGTGIGHSTLEVLQLVEKITGTEIPIEWSDDRPSDVRSIVLDTSRLQSVIAWHPVELERGISETWAMTGHLPSAETEHLGK